MFKMGFKKILLTLSLIFVLSIVFVSCKDSKVTVSNIQFKETQSIVMVIGQTYTPNVSVTPSYATNKGYYFSVSSNTDIVKIEDTTITALKEGVVQLKVTSEENENLTDIIALTVLPSKINLSCPQNLSFDGEIFSFSPVNYATNYLININGRDFDLGNSVSWTLKQYADAIGDSAYDSVLNIKVKALGDERIAINSPYSDAKSFVKISKPSAIVQDNNLKIEKINNVNTYSINFANKAANLFSLTLDAVANTELTINLSDYAGYFTGGEYYCSIIATNERYSLSADSVLNSNNFVLVFDVLAAPKNLNVVDYTLHWDSVSGADYYTLYNNNTILQDNLETTYFDFKSLSSTGAEFNFKLVANSNTNLNVVDNFNVSTNLEISVLSAPTNLKAENYVISWDDVAGNAGYNLKILKDGVEQESIVLMTNSYTVSKYQASAGKYGFKLETRGNNINTLSSLESSSKEFTVLEAVSNLKVEDMKIVWSSSIENGKYEVVVDSPSDEAYINEIVETNLLLNLSAYTLESGNYTVKVTAIDETTLFNSTTSTTNFYKLTEISASTISNKSISITRDAKTDTTKGKIYKLGDADETDLGYLTKVSESSYSLNDSTMESGTYIIEFEALGNGEDILNADNADSASARFLEVIKLGTPSLKIDKATMELSLNGTVENAVSYKLFENGTNKGIISVGSPISVASVSAGEHVYTVQALGNNANILDGNESSSNIKVYRLAKPSISFDTNSLKCTIQTTEEKDNDVLASREVILTFTNPSGAEMTAPPDYLTSGTFYCSSLVDSCGAGTYKATVKLIGKDETGSGYDLIIDSEEISASVTKKENTSTLTLESNKICIKPTKSMSGYTAEISYSYNGAEFAKLDASKIEYNTSEKRFEFKVLEDDGYTAVSPFDKPGEYKFKVKYVKDGDISTDEYIFGDADKVVKLDKAAGVGKNYTLDANNIPTESFAFSAVEGATIYKFIVSNGSKSYSLEQTGVSITFDNLKKGINGIAEENFIGGGKTYSLQVVAIGDDANKIISSGLSDSYTWEVLTQPSIAIAGDVITISKCAKAEYVVLKAYNAESPKEGLIEKITPESGKVIIDIANIYKLKDFAVGTIKFEVVAVNTGSRYFKSIAAKSGWVQLKSPEIKIEKGAVTWELLDKGVSSYSLTYKYVDGAETKEITIDLTEGVTNYTIDKDKNIAKYTLKSEEKITGIKVQAIGAGNVKETIDDKEVTTYYYSSKVGEFSAVTKLNQATVSTVNGKLKIVLNDSLSYVSAVYIDGKSVSSYGTSLSSEMIIEPEKLLKYSGKTKIEDESFKIDVIAKNGYLNANQTIFTVKGLKALAAPTISTDIDYDDVIIESLDSIKWEHNTLNEGFVSGYLLEINYNEETYTYDDVGAETTSYAFPDDITFVEGCYSYNVRIKALTTADGYLNSKFSEYLTVTLCEQAKGLKTTDGVIGWDPVSGANEYIVKVSTVAESKYFEVTETSFALGDDYTAGHYKIIVYATNKSDSTIITGAASEEVEVLKLPQITKYKVIDGELYVYVHSLVSKVKLTLTDSKGAIIEETLDLTDYGTGNLYDINLKDELTPSLAFAEITGAWSKQPDLGLTTGEEAESKLKNRYIKVLVGETKTSVLDILADIYTVSSIAIGNSGTEDLTVCSAACENLTNVTNPSAELQKLTTPTIFCEEKGIVGWQIGSDPANTNTNLNYGGGLECVLVYEITITMGKDKHSYWGVDNIPADITITENEEITNEQVYFGYFALGGRTYNILRKSTTETMLIDFTKQALHYLDKDGVKKELIFADGGNFTISVRILGDNVSYLTSNSSKQLELVRYKQNNLSVVNGYLTWENLKVGKDDPIYLLKTINSSGEVIYLYIYDSKSEYGEPDIDELPIYEEGKTFFKGINFTDVDGNVIPKLSYMFNSVDDNEYTFNSGKYNVVLTTYYRDSGSNLRLASKPSTEFEIYKLAAPEITVNKGVLTWNQIKVGENAITSYRLTVGGEAITITPSILNGVCSYILPSEINDCSLNQGSTYDIGLMALTISGSKYINSNYSKAKDFTISPEIMNVKMSNGKLTWVGSSDNGYEIKIEVYDKEKTLTNTIYKTGITDTEYDLESSLIDDKGLTVNLTEGNYYKFFVKSVGNNNFVISGFYTELDEYVERFKSLTFGSINTDAGVLTWDPIKNLANEEISDVAYVLTIKQGAETVETEKLAVASFNFAGYASGKYTVILQPSHNNFFAGASSTVTVYKLGTATNLIAVEAENAISFDPVLVNDTYAESYEIKWSVDNWESYETTTYTPENKETTITYTFTESLTTYSVQVRAIMTSNDIDIINGEWSAEYKCEKAESVDGTTFKVSDDGLRFEWEPITNENKGEEYLLNFTLETAVGSSLKQIYIDSEDYDEDNKKYYYNLTEVGIYSNIFVYVNRKGANSSNKTYMQKEQGGTPTNVTYNFTIFKSGNGTESMPYVIETLEHLKNISIFTDAYYIMNNDISISELEGPICNEFKGTLDGNNKSLTSFDHTFTSNHSGLFGMLNGASIKNLIITRVNITISNTYGTKDLKDDDKIIYGGILSAKAENTIFDNINVSQSTLNVTAQDDNTLSEPPYFYYGGLSGHITDCSIVNCNIALGYVKDTTTYNSDIKITGNSNDYFYFGGIAGYINNDDSIKVENITTTVYYKTIISSSGSSKYMPNTYFGGVFGCVENSIIGGDLTVTINQDEESENHISYHAGVCGLVTAKLNINNLNLSGVIGIGSEQDDDSAKISKTANIKDGAVLKEPSNQVIEITLRVY